MPIYVYLDGCERSLVETPEEALHLLPPLRGHLGSRLRRRCGGPLQEEKPESDDEGDQARSHRCHCALRGTILQLVLQAVCSAQRRPNVLAFYRGSRSSSDVHDGRPGSALLWTRQSIFRPYAPFIGECATPQVSASGSWKFQLTTGPLSVSQALQRTCLSLFHQMLSAKSDELEYSKEHTTIGFGSVRAYCQIVTTISVTLKRQDNVNPV